MINYLLAEQNINKYKYDYDGYLVIIDKIRTKEILLTSKLKEMQEHLKMLKEKYKNELNRIMKIENIKLSNSNVFKMSKKEIIFQLEYIYNRLPAIGYIRLNLEKEIGII